MMKLREGADLIFFIKTISPEFLCRVQYRASVDRGNAETGAD